MRAVLLIPLCTLCLAVLTLSIPHPALAFTARQCDEEGAIARVITTYRDRGVSESMVTIGAKDRFSDPDIREPITTLIHTIYTSESMAHLSPDQIGEAVAQVCKQQASKP